MKRLLNVDEAKKIWQSHSKRNNAVSAYPVGKRRESLYVCMNPICPNPMLIVLIRKTNSC